ncbi:NTP transferase domain-containing protein [Dietzia cinnamea]|uniref:Molybdopterin molybdenumtransferase n=1 Tax=Dietzia cinnamea TaxID=321318 RepID=A0A4R3ZU82_9ACTN|nr:NTP transferase domain-containing protein [Dietzia cinnamea]TCW23918.1 molybdopterin biosynthesis enzyme [Dietzia cinnamea]
MTTVGAIVLAGGRASRLGGVDKARVTVAGRPMIESVVGAARDVAGPVITVGPGGDTREDPPHSGPVAAIAAGLAGLPGAVELVVVVACDLPDLDAATLRALLAALRRPTASTTGAGEVSASRAALAVDAAGRDQYLLAAWDRRALAARLAALEASGGVGGRAVRALYDDDEEVVRVPVGDPARDVDTWADLAGRGPVALAHVGPVLRAGLAPLPAVGRAPLDAVGAVLAAPLIAADPMPRGPVSAMDGYALAGPGPWRLTGAARRAGDDSPASLTKGTAARIATGALAPRGTDRVLRHELVEVRGPGSGDAAVPGDTVVTASAGADGVDDLRPVGEDWPAGRALAADGTVLDAALASAALSAGVERVPVRGPVRATLVTTGDEVLPADTPSPLPPGRIRDTVGPLLSGPAGVLARAGFGAVDPPRHCPDTAEAVDDLLGGPDSGSDVLVLVGATGRGVADHLRPALERLGARVVIDGVRVRPGGSQLVAALPDGRVLLALPGNPLAAVCAAATTGRALVDALTGRQRTPVTADLPGLADVANPGRARILPARPDGTGGWRLADRVRTAHLADLAGAPALAVVPEGGDAGAGAEAGASAGEGTGTGSGSGPGGRVELVDWI